MLNKENLGEEKTAANSYSIRRLERMQDNIHNKPIKSEKTAENNYSIRRIQNLEKEIKEQNQRKKYINETVGEIKQYHQDFKEFDKNSDGVIDILDRVIINKEYIDEYSINPVYDDVNYGIENREELENLDLNTTKEQKKTAEHNMYVTYEKANNIAQKILMPGYSYEEEYVLPNDDVDYDSENNYYSDEKRYDCASQEHSAAVTAYNQISLEYKNAKFLQDIKPYENLTQNEDFEEKSKPVESSKKGESVSMYAFITRTGKFANISEEDLKKAIFEPESSVIGTTFEQKYFCLTKKERKIYTYIHNTKGEKEANKYLELLDDKLKIRQGYEIYETVKDDGAISKGFFAVASGLDRSVVGTKGFINEIFGNDEEIVSPVQVASAYVQNDIDSTAGRIAYSVFENIGNMLPAIAVSGMTAGIAGGLGAAASTVNLTKNISSAGMIFLTSSGYAYNSAIAEGKTVGEARAFGLLSGTSEAFMQYALNGISPLGEGKIAAKFSNTVNDAIGKVIKNPTLKIMLQSASHGLISSGGEFTEEYLQEVVEPLFRNICFGEDNKVKMFSSDALYSGFVGALTAGVLNAPSNIHQIGTQIIFKKAGISVMKEVHFDTAKTLDEATKILNAKLATEEFSTDTSKEILQKAYAQRVSEIEKGITADIFEDQALKELQEEVNRLYPEDSEQGTPSAEFINDSSAQNNINQNNDLDINETNLQQQLEEIASERMVAEQNNVDVESIMPNTNIDLSNEINNENNIYTAEMNTQSVPAADFVHALVNVKLSDGNVSEMRIASFESTEHGQPMLRTQDKKSVSLSEVKFKDKTTDQLYNLGAEYDTYGARAFVANYKSGLDVNTYKKAFDDYYAAGFDNKPINEVITKNADVLSQAEGQSIYFAAQNDMNNNRNFYERKIEAVDIKTTTESLAKATGREIQVYSGSDINEDGYVDSKGVIHINENSTTNKIVGGLHYTIAHELTHTLERTQDGKYYRRLKDYVLNSPMFEAALLDASEQLNETITLEKLKEHMKDSRYEHAKRKAEMEGRNTENIKRISDEMAEREIIADFIAKNLFKDEKSINHLANNDYNLFIRIKNAVHNLWIKFKNLKYVPLSSVSELGKIENLFTKANMQYVKEKNKNTVQNSIKKADTHTDQLQKAKISSSSVSTNNNVSKNDNNVNNNYMQKSENVAENFGKIKEVESPLVAQRPSRANTTNRNNSTSNVDTRTDQLQKAKINRQSVSTGNNVSQNDSDVNNNYMQKSENVAENNENQYSLKLRGYNPEIKATTKDVLEKYNINNINNKYEVSGKISEYLQKSFLSTIKIHKPILNIDTGIEIEIRKKGIKETFENDRYFLNLSNEEKLKKIAIVEYLPKLIKYGEVRSKEASNYHNPQSKLRYAYLVGPASIDGKEYSVNIDIRRAPTGENNFYIHSVNEIQIKKDDGYHSRNAERLTDNQSSSNIRISQNDSDVNNNYMQKSENVAENEQGNIRIPEEEISYSISSDFKTQIDEVLNNTFNKENTHVYLGDTPKSLQQIGFDNIPLLATVRHIYNITVSEQKAIADRRFNKNSHYHNLGKDVVYQLPKAIDNPAMIIKSNSDINNTDVVIVTNLFDKVNRPVIVAVKLKGKGNLKGFEIEANILKSAYGRSNFNNYIKRASEENRILVYNKKESQDLINPPGVQFPDNLNNLDFDDSLTRYREIVNNNYMQKSENVAEEFSLSEDMFETDQKYVNGMYSDLYTKRIISLVKKYGNSQIARNAKEEIRETSQSYADHLIEEKKVSEREGKRKVRASYELTKSKKQINKTVNSLIVKCLSPSNQKHVSEEFRADIMKFCSLFDFDTGWRKPVSETVQLSDGSYDTRIYSTTTAKQNEWIEKHNSVLLFSKQQYEYANTKEERLRALSELQEMMKQNDTQGLYEEEYKGEIADDFETIKRIMWSKGEINPAKLTLKETEAVNNILGHLNCLVRYNNRLFNDKIKEDFDEIGKKTIRLLESKLKSKEPNRYKDEINYFTYEAHWGSLTPETLFHRIGGPLESTFKLLREKSLAAGVGAENVKIWMVDELEKHGYDKKWKDDYQKIKLADGRTMLLSTEEKMNIFALSRRPQALTHLLGSGITTENNVAKANSKEFKMLNSYEKVSALRRTAFKITEGDINNITESLTQNQKALADAMMSYMSEVLSEIGNETTMQCYGYKKFIEKNYWPIVTSKSYLNTNTTNANNASILSPGWSKSTVKNANNPIIIKNATEIFATHAMQMINYNAMTASLIDFNRVYNYSFVSETGKIYSVKSQLEEAFGKKSTAYIEKLLKDINGAAIKDPATDSKRKVLSKVKKVMVAANLSVIIQQPTAICRAAAVMNPKYLFESSLGSRRERIWKEVKQYAGVAVIKEIGRIDVLTGRTFYSWLMNEQSLDDNLLKLAELADRITWCHIWNAVKSEIADTTTLVSGTEEFFERCGERFTGIINETQVYDSIFTRSEMMRSDDMLVQTRTAFLGEPTQTYNMIYRACIDKANGELSNSQAAQIGTAIAVNMIVNAAVQSIMGAIRDYDDEDKTFWEKYLDRFVSNFIGGGISLIPIVKEGYSMLEGYSCERLDITAMKKASQVVQKTKKVFQDGVSIEGLSAISDPAIQLASYISGVPIYNILRDVKSIGHTGYQMIFGSNKTIADFCDVVFDGDEKSAIDYYDELSDDYKDTEKLNNDIKSEFYEMVFEIARDFGINSNEFEKAYRTVLEVKFDENTSFCTAKGLESSLSSRKKRLLEEYIKEIDKGNKSKCKVLEKQLINLYGSERDVNEEIEKYREKNSKVENKQPKISLG